MSNKIGPKVIGTIKHELGMLLDDHASRMDRAYLELEDDLSVSIGLKFAEHKGGLKISYRINYTTGKVKDGDTIIIDEKQLGLFEDEDC